MAWESSDLILAGSTALLGLLAGQAGAWVQSKRDAKTQLARDNSEKERLTLQLEAQTAEARANRANSDLLDWRSRRIDAYRQVSLNAGIVEESALIQAGSGEAWVDEILDPPGKALNQHLGRLRAAVEEAGIVSDGPCRAAATSLYETADRTVKCAFTLSRLTKMQDEGRDPTPHVKHSSLRAALDDMTPPPPGVLRQQKVDAEEQWRAARAKFVEAMEQWTTASRIGLGVPD
jgi:hypothetical protein